MCKNNFCPLHCHSYYSLLDGLSSPKDIVRRCKELELPAVALTDHGSIAGLPAFHEAGKKYGVKTISACELYICEQDPLIKSKENDRRYHLTVLAKNADGFKALMALATECNRPDYFYRKPRISLEKIKPFADRGGLICLSGCLAGELSSSILVDVNEACNMKYTEEDIEKMLVPNWKEIGRIIIEKYRAVFGKDNFYIEIQDEGAPVQKVVLRCLRILANEMGIKKVGTQDSHYTEREDAEDQRILLYSNMHTTQEEQEQLKQTGGDTMMFFHTDTFYIFNQQEAEEKYTKDEIENSFEIAEKCSAYSLNRSPCIPKYTSDQTESSDDLIQKICIENAKIKLKHLTKEKKQFYWDRLQKELYIIKDAKLSDYFLIVYDACKFIDENKAPRGKGRGSGSGCLVNYLLGITKLDPIEYDLYFERFYNASRNIPAHFDMGDIPFMKWLGDNFDSLRFMNLEKSKDYVLKELRGIYKSGKYKTNELERIREEIAWIERFSPKMWFYLENCLKNLPKKIEFENNSIIGYMLGLANEFKIENPLKYKDSHVSLPDIDTDVSIEFRDKLIEYLSTRWGADRVSQMITFGRLQGRAALKEVFRAQPETVKHLIKLRELKKNKESKELPEKPLDVCNEITKFIPDEASISDELQQIREETGDEDYGILRWSVDHVPELKEAYESFKPLFDQAMRLEGTKKNSGKHAAGIIIAAEPIDNIVPMAYNAKDKNTLCGVEMGIAEKMGAVKFDFLGVAALDKVASIVSLVNNEYKS